MSDTTKPESKTPLHDALIRAGIPEDDITDFCRRFVVGAVTGRAEFKPTDKDFAIIRKLL